MVLSTQNSGKYLTRTYERDKNAGELDSTGLTAADISFLEIQDGQGQMKYDITGAVRTSPLDPLTPSKIIDLQENEDGVLHLY